MAAGADPATGFGVAGDGGGVTETVVRMSGDSDLLGVLSRPNRTNGPEVGALLLDVGLTYRAGPNRLYVRIARLLAAQGIPTLRFDFSGVGDSPPRSDLLPFSESGPLETVRAMDWMREELGIQRLLLIGFCSGANVAFRTAVRDMRVAGIGLLNHRSLEADEYSDLRSMAESYGTLGAVASSSRWWRAISGRTDYRAVFRSLMAAAVVLLRGQAQSHQASEVARDFRALSTRGTAIGLFFAENEFGRRYLKLALGRDYHDLIRAPAVSEHIIPRSDHLFTSAKSQKLLLDQLDSWARSVTARSEAR